MEPTVREWLADGPKLHRAFWGEEVVMALEGQEIPSDWQDLVVYRAGELEHIAGLTSDALETIHLVKKTFPDSRAVDVENGLPSRVARRWTQEQCQAAWDQWSPAQREHYIEMRKLAQRSCSDRLLVASWAAERAEEVQ